MDKCVIFSDMIRNKCRMMFSGSGNLLGECGIMDLGHKYNFSNVAMGKHHRYTETYSCNYVKKLGQCGSFWKCLSCESFTSLCFVPH